jgi:hypothetical protein
MEPQSQEFKTKMKVSNPLNDIAANLGVTPKVLTQLATGEDKEFRELVRGIFSILPEDEVIVVAGDSGINANFLDYLSRLFEDNPRILLTILFNPSASEETQNAILQKILEDEALSIAGNKKTPPHVLDLMSKTFQDSADILATLLANPATPEDVKEFILTISSPEIEADLEQLMAASFDISSAEASGEEDVDAKIALCVDKLYAINADIVTEFIKKARAEILKRLTLMAKANRLILKTIVQHPSLTIEELDRIDLDMFASLLKKSPDNVDDQTVLQLLQQAKRGQNNNTSANNK